MEDIIEIYEPIYRDQNNILRNIIIVTILSLVFIIIYFVINKIKKKRSIITPEQRFTNVMNKYVDLQKKIDSLTSENFSSYSSFIFKEYLTEIYNSDFLSSTSEELIVKLNTFATINSEVLADIFINKLDPAQFGKLDLSIKEKSLILKEIVDYITALYNQIRRETND